MGQMSMTANGHPRNGHPVTVSGPMPVLAPEMGPSSPWPPYADPEATTQEPPAAVPVPPPAAAEATARVPRERFRWPSLRLPDADTVITWSMAATVALVAIDAAIVSYSHIYGLATGQTGNGAETGVQARLLPLSIDGVIAEASLVKLYAARHKPVGRTRLATFMLWLGIVATVAANITHGLPSSLVGRVPHIVIFALLSAWPAGAFIGSVEMAMGLVRSMRDVAASVVGSDAGDDTNADKNGDTGDRDSDTGTPPGQDSGDSGSDSDTTGEMNGGTKATRKPNGKAAQDPVSAAIKRTRGWRQGGEVNVPAVARKCGVSVRTVERRLKDLRNAS